MDNPFTQPTTLYTAHAVVSSEVKLADYILVLHEVIRIPYEIKRTTLRWMPGLRSNATLTILQPSLASYGTIL